MPHIPVLLKETIKILDPRPGEFFVDGTLGKGGHAKEVLKQIGSKGIFLGVDWDPKALESCKLKIGDYENVIFVQDNFANLPEILAKNNLPQANGLILDLGFSSEQIENLNRGFSFQSSAEGDEPLLMTYSDGQKPAHEWLKRLKELELAGIIKKFGEERYAFKIAKAIKKNLPITTTGKLADLIKDAVPRNYERGRIHPATRTFMALRIFVNNELENLEVVLRALDSILARGGRAAIISFNSLEDRIVKRHFTSLAKEKKAILLNKKPIESTREELIENPRARSAKLRAIRII